MGSFDTSRYCLLIFRLESEVRGSFEEVAEEVPREVPDEVPDEVKEAGVAGSDEMLGTLPLDI